MKIDNIKQEEIELNEHGRLAFQNKFMPYLFAHRAYRWKDRIIFLDEKNERTVIHVQKYSQFDHSAWRAVTKEEDKKVINTYDELNYAIN